MTNEDIAPATSASDLLIRVGGISWGWRKVVLLALTFMVIAGAALRLNGLGAIGFAEDEINKVVAVRAYDRGDFTANAEHPMLMKLVIDLSLRAAQEWTKATGRIVSDEFALRFPNAIFGALTAVPLFLLTAALFDRGTALWAAAFWSFGITAITFNRIGKEDTFMVFFMLFAFYFFIRAKQTDGRRRKRVSRLRNSSGISFGLMMASKYFPHYLGLNMLYHHNYSVRERVAGEPRWKTPLSFFLITGIAFLITNPAILLPKVWMYLNAYSGEKLLTHTGYLMGNRLYRNNISRSPFWATPVYFYLLFLAIKVPLSILVTFLLGLFVSVRNWRLPGHGFVLLMLFFWIVPYSLMGAKWPRYLLSLMPFVYISAAVGVMALVRWFYTEIEKRRMNVRLPRLVTAALLALLVVWPASSAYASAPHYALYTNLLAHRYTAYFFPHDEFYDDGLKEAIQFVCARAPREATIVSETPGVVLYYTAKFGRADLQARTLSDPNISPSQQPNAFFILQRGRTYFENEEEMKQVRAQFPLIYAGCVRGHTAAEVYSRQPAGVAPACGDGQS